MQNKIIKDTLPLYMSLEKQEEKIMRNHGLPTIGGKLFSKDEYGNETFVNDNCVVIGGAILTLQKLLGVKAKFIPDTLNTMYGVNDRIPVDDSKTNLCLFGLGIGGSDLTFGVVHPPKFNHKNIPQMIPLRVADSDTLDSSDADKYYFKKPLTENSGKYGWFLKEFDKVPDIKSHWKDLANPDQDGSEITEDISNTNIEPSEPNQSLVSVFGEHQIKITHHDGKEYFEMVDQMVHARFNTIGFYTGQKVEISEGYWDYINVRLQSYVTFDNVSLKEKTELTYVYRLYTAI